MISPNDQPLSKPSAIVPKDDGLGNKFRWSLGLDHNWARDMLFTMILPPQGIDVGAQGFAPYGLDHGCTGMPLLEGGSW